jgi:hypothetical protein
MDMQVEDNLTTGANIGVRIPSRRRGASDSLLAVSQEALVKRQFGHRARLALSPAEVSRADAQAHAARTMWNLLHAWWQMMPKDKRTLANADAAIRQAAKTSISSPSCPRRPHKRC